MALSGVTAVWFYGLLCGSWLINETTREIFYHWQRLAWKGMARCHPACRIYLNVNCRLEQQKWENDDDMNATWEKYNVGFIAGNRRSGTGIDLHKQEAEEKAETTKAIEAAALAKSSAEQTASLKKAASDAAAKIFPAGAT